MSKTTIPTGGITADAIDATLIADDAISEEHLDQMQKLIIIFFNKNIECFVSGI